MNIPWKGTCGGSRICEPGLSCKQSSCFKETEVVYLKKCSKDLDCEGHPYSPYKCFNNTCMFYSYYGDPCVSDEQCETQKCRNNICVSLRNTGEECYNTDQCPITDYCDNHQRCKPLVEKEGEYCGDPSRACKYPLVCSMDGKCIKMHNKEGAVCHHFYECDPKYSLFCLPDKNPGSGVIGKCTNFLRHMNKGVGENVIF